MAQIFGKIHKIYEIQQITDKFQKREFVIITDTQFPQHILVELQHDSVYLIDSFPVGSIVAVSINLKGRSWTNPQGEEKYFNTIVAWKIEIAPSELNKPTLPTPDPQYAPPAPATFNEEADDLPF